MAFEADFEEAARLMDQQSPLNLDPSNLDYRIQASQSNIEKVDTPFHVHNALEAFYHFAGVATQRLVEWAAHNMWL